MVHVHDVVALLKRRDEIECELLDTTLFENFLEGKDFTISEERAFQIRILERVGEMVFVIRWDDGDGSGPSVSIVCVGNTLFLEYPLQLLRTLRHNQECPFLLQFIAYIIEDVRQCVELENGKIPEMCMVLLCLWKW